MTPLPSTFEVSPHHVVLGDALLRRPFDRRQELTSFSYQNRRLRSCPRGSRSSGDGQSGKRLTIDVILVDLRRHRPNTCPRWAGQDLVGSGTYGSPASVVETHTVAPPGSGLAYPLQIRLEDPGHPRTSRQQWQQRHRDRANRQARHAAVHGLLWCPLVQAFSFFSSRRMRYSRRRADGGRIGRKNGRD